MYLSAVLSLMFLSVHSQQIVVEGFSDQDTYFDENSDFGLIIRQDEKSETTDNSFKVRFVVRNDSDIEYNETAFIPKTSTQTTLMGKYNNDGKVSKPVKVQYYFEELVVPFVSSDTEAEPGEFYIKNTETATLSLQVVEQTDSNAHIGVNTDIPIEADTEVWLYYWPEGQEDKPLDLGKAVIKKGESSALFEFDLLGLGWNIDTTTTVGIKSWMTDSDLQEFLIKGQDASFMYSTKGCTQLGGVHSFVGTFRNASSNSASSQTDYGIIDSTSPTGGWVGGFYQPWTYDIELDGGNVVAFNGVFTQGNGIEPAYKVNQFELFSSMDGKEWTSHGLINVSAYDGQEIQAHTLPDGAISARWMRVAIENGQFTNKVSMRLNGHGCKISTCLDDPNFNGPYGKCASYASGMTNEGFCDDTYFGKKVTEWCPQSCGVCGPFVDPVDITSAPTATPTSPTATPTESPTAAAVEVDYPNTMPCMSAPSDKWESPFGDCASYAADICENNLLCNYWFCAADGANYYCPLQCNTCNGDDPDWAGQFGKCDSYTADKCDPSPATDFDCNHNYCDTDLDKQTNTISASVACRKACGTGNIPKPTEAPAMMDCPDADSITWDGGYGGCDSYDEALCIGDPDNCNYQFCTADQAAANDACPITCHSCNSCKTMPINTCEGLCADEDPIPCSVAGKCFCDVVCSNTDDCCPGRAESCSIGRASSASASARGTRGRNLVAKRTRHVPQISRP